MSRHPRHAGWTLLEIMIGIAIMGLLLGIAVPTYYSRIDKMKVDQAKRDLIEIATRIERYRTTHNFALPEDLADIGDVALDPWGHAYQYLNFNSSAPGVKGKIRKDHNLHPLNSEFDLYSMGADGKSVSPLTGKPSRDDVIWGRDGSFVGLASDF